MSNIVDYSKRELALLNKDNDVIQERINKNIIEIVETFSNQGHTGFTASYVLGVIDRLLRWKPIMPLTGEADEWKDCGFNKGYKQNKRCGSVFLDKNGVAIDHDEIMISDDGGYTWFYSNIIPLTPITFPYTPPEKPKEVYIEYTDAEKKDFDIITNDPDRIKALYERKIAERS